MNNQQKLTTRSSKLRVHRANSQTISLYLVRFSTDNRYSLFFFNFFCFFLSFFFLFFFCFLYFFTWKKEYMFWYTFGYAGGWVIKKFSPGRFSETKLLFSWPEKLAPKIRSTHVEVFCKKGGRKLRKIHSKTPVPESLF